MILPQKNASIIAVNRGGKSEDYGDEATDGAAVWNGSADAYFARRRATATEAGALNRIQVAYVVVPGDLGIAFRTGDVLTLLKRGATVKVTVRELPDRDLDGPIAQPIRLDLEEV